MKEKIQKIANRIDKSNKSFWTTYIVLSAFFFLCFWFGFLIHGKGFIWSVDGLEQQYMFFILQASGLGIFSLMFLWRIRLRFQCGLPMLDMARIISFR